MKTLVQVVAVLFFQLGVAPAWGHCGHHDLHDCDCRDSSAPCSPCRDLSSSRRQNQDALPSVTAQPAKSVEGKVVEVVYLPGASSETAMVEVWLLAAKERTLVRIGAAGFLKQNKFSLKEGDTLAVKGYTVATAERDVVVAVEMRKGNQTLVLRNEQGTPRW